MAIVCLFLANDLSWAIPSGCNPPGHATLAAQSRFKPFFEKHGLDFQNMAAVIYAAARLKELLIDENELDDIAIKREINRLNRLFRDGAVRIRDEIQDGRLKGTGGKEGRPFRYAVFDFVKETKTIDILLFKDHANLTAADLAELGIEDKERHHLDSPGIEGVWFVNRSPGMPPHETDLSRYLIDNITHYPYKGEYFAYSYHAVDLAQLTAIGRGERFENIKVNIANIIKEGLKPASMLDVVGKLQQSVNPHRVSMQRVSWPKPGIDRDVPVQLTPAEKVASFIDDMIGHNMWGSDVKVIIRNDLVKGLYNPTSVELAASSVPPEAIIGYVLTDAKPRHHYYLSYELYERGTVEDIFVDVMKRIALETPHLARPVFRARDRKCIFGEPESVRLESIGSGPEGTGSTAEPVQDEPQIEGGMAVKGSSPSVDKGKNKGAEGNEEGVDKGVEKGGEVNEEGMDKGGEREVEEGEERVDKGRQRRGEWEEVAARIDDENRNYGPTGSEKTVFCHIIADSIVPDQKDLLQVLEQDMAKKGEGYIDRVACLEFDGSKDFVKQVVEKMDAYKKRCKDQGEDYDLEFDVACPSIEHVTAILNSGLGIKALAFAPCKEPAQVHGIILALRALHTGKLENLMAVSGIIPVDHPEKLAGIKTIEDFVKQITFILPAAKELSYEDRRKLNDIIRENIKIAA